MNADKIPLAFIGVHLRLKLRCCTILNKPFMNRQDACSTKSEFSCGTGILPVKREWCKM
ncbi:MULTISPECIES: hypothetical protein [unclassified Microcoleus]|uniref:hypothetical protein n=1 Tax=unclassified Microcoleus TaxID=2642155 RepID=UPI002FD1C57A